MKFSATAIILIFSFHFLFSQNSIEKAAKLVFYNVENLFDIVDDTQTNDNEFTPSGIRHWTNNKFEKKIKNIARVITSVGGWHGAAAIGLCEVENLYVLERLTNHPLLKNFNYKIIHKESPDHRGIDVALIYDEDQFKPVDYEYIPLIGESGDVLYTREMLHVTGKIEGLTKVHLFVCHWPSRYGGLTETEAKRKLAAKILKDRIDNICKEQPNAKIICMGDFNDQPQNESMQMLVEDSLINLSSSWMKNGIGTLKYQQSWNVFDQFIISKNLMLLVSESHVFNPNFLFVEDKKYSGTKLFRTYNGYKYQGGFSDHLPIVMELSIH